MGGDGFPWNSTQTASVEIFNASGRLVAHHAIRESHPHFRFGLAPGRYKVELKAGRALCGPDTEMVRVRAHKTVRLNLSEYCDNSY